jgi:hypothetical protein
LVLAFVFKRTQFFLDFLHVELVGVEEVLLVLAEDVGQVLREG